MNDRWRELAGLPARHRSGLMPPLEALEKSEWSPEFEQHMRDRLLMGAYRYGCLNECGKPVFDRMPDAQRRLQLYCDTGNTEYLVDAANMCMIEYEEGRHPRKHFTPTDDGEHTEVKELGTQHRIS